VYECVSLCEFTRLSVCVRLRSRTELRMDFQQRGYNFLLFIHVSPDT